MVDDLFKGYGVEIVLKTPEDFLKIKETLGRIGVTAKNEKKLFASCAILHKKGRYAIVHFKELFAFDGRTADTTEEDLNRRNLIVQLLADWKLLDIVNKEWFNQQSKLSISQIKIVPFKEKKDWVLVEKYKIGKKD